MAEREFEPNGDIVVDIGRLLARAAMQLSKVKPPSERQREHLDIALGYMRYAGDLLNEWDLDRLDEIADDAAISALVERHVTRILSEKAGSVPHA